MIQFLAYNEPVGQIEQSDTVIEANFRLRPWRYKYPTVHGMVSEKG